ncbi:hypothetical protein BY996DRAFT_6552913 [Phakopsora pachyrhizi]|nr:hypothetical protein BY996DRAFT_6552913 [Phakopsora pachyrhizi]
MLALGRRELAENQKKELLQALELRTRMKSASCILDNVGEGKICSGEFGDHIFAHDQVPRLRYIDRGRVEKQLELSRFEGSLHIKKHDLFDFKVSCSANRWGSEVGNCENHDAACQILEVIRCDHDSLVWRYPSDLARDTERLQAAGEISYGFGGCATSVLVILTRKEFHIGLSSKNRTEIKIDEQKRWKINQLAEVKEKNDRQMVCQHAPVNSHKQRRHMFQPLIARSLRALKTKALVVCDKTLTKNGFLANSFALEEVMARSRKTQD